MLGSTPGSSSVSKCSTTRCRTCSTMSPASSAPGASSLCWSCPAAVLGLLPAPGLAPAAASMPGTAPVCISPLLVLAWELSGAGIHPCINVRMRGATPAASKAGMSKPIAGWGWGSSPSPAALRSCTAAIARSGTVMCCASNLHSSKLLACAAEAKPTRRSSGCASYWVSRCSMIALLSCRLLCAATLRATFRQHSHTWYSHSAAASGVESARAQLLCTWWGTSHPRPPILRHFRR
mmetsp:Transcript_33771/g.85500  ORF Transcript_33771/g.85500 Transcript_33771/m.85500 type:complete len:236 (-) Transcript_33771:172-879(-)